MTRIAPFSILICVLINCNFTVGTDYYVKGKTGSDLHGGTKTAPFKTIQRCVSALEEPGDKCLIGKGTYHEDMIFTGKHATPFQPFIVTGYEDERPLIDGTVPLTFTTSWTKLKPHDPMDRTYKAKIKEEIYQLFVDGEMMTNARWPNALWSDRTVFNFSYWARSDGSSDRDRMVDGGRNLERLPFSVEGAMAILNIGSFNTYVAKVSHHTQGENWFRYKNDTFGYHHFTARNNIYFLETNLSC